MENYDQLREILELEKLEENLYRGQNYMAPWGRVFGGQVVAQALQAALQTVPDDRQLHSMHSYFLLAGDLSVPIVYQVDRLRDGGSFNTRQVSAVQKGRPIFTLTCSFHSEAEGFYHDQPMPDVPPPEECKTNVELAATAEGVDKDFLRMVGSIQPIERRLPGGHDQLLYKDKGLSQSIWIKAKGDLGGDSRFHQIALAYASDYTLISNAVTPHLGKFKIQQLFMASLDHSIWFHQPLRLDEWLLYTMESPHASGSRGFVRGTIYNRDGKIVASVAQEGLLRVMDDDKK